MPIASYLVYPVEGEHETLCATLQSLPGCTLVNATNASMSILITETSGLEEEKALHQTLKRCDALECLVLVMGEVDGDMAPPVPDTFDIPTLEAEARAHG